MSVGRGYRRAAISFRDEDSLARPTKFRLGDNTPETAQRAVFLPGKNGDAIRYAQSPSSATALDNGGAEGVVLTLLLR